MYHWNDRNQMFTFHQRLNISGSELALNNDILVIGDGDKTHIFSEKYDGQWEETITLDGDYWSYALSGRGLLATKLNDGVYYFDIEDCSKAMPTQAPSLSWAPTDRPHHLQACDNLHLYHHHLPPLLQIHAIGLKLPLLMMNIHLMFIFPVWSAQLWSSYAQKLSRVTDFTYKGS